MNDDLTELRPKKNSQEAVPSLELAEKKLRTFSHEATEAPNLVQLQRVYTFQNEEDA